MWNWGAVRCIVVVYYLSFYTLGMVGMVIEYRVVNKVYGIRCFLWTYLDVHTLFMLLLGLVGMANVILEAIELMHSTSLCL